MLPLGITEFFAKLAEVVLRNIWGKFCVATGLGLKPPSGSKT